MAEENYPMIKGTIHKMDRTEDRAELARKTEEYLKKNKIIQCDGVYSNVAEVILDRDKKELESRKKEKSKGKNNKDYRTQVSWGNRK